MNEEVISQGMSFANRSVLSRSVESVVAAHTTNPVVGRLAGDATGFVYKSIPSEIKCGAGASALGTAMVAAKIYSIGTLGAAAFAGSIIAAAPAVIVGGALIGGVFWLCKKLDS